MLSSKTVIKFFLLGLIASLAVTSVYGKHISKRAADPESAEVREKRQLGGMMGGLGGGMMGGLGGGMMGAGMMGGPMMGGGLMGGGGGILDLLVLSSILGGGNNNFGGDNGGGRSRFNHHHH